MSSTPERPPGWRAIDPPRKVWVDLPRLFPVHSHHMHVATPHGLQTSYEAAGVLVEEVRWANGGRLGLVRYQLLTADHQWQTVVSQYVPSHLYRPMHRRRDGRDNGGLGH